MTKGRQTIFRKKNLRIFCLLWFNFVLCFYISAQHIKIGISSAYFADKFYFEPLQGNYRIFSGDTLVKNINNNEVIIISNTGSCIKIENLDGVIGCFKDLSFEPYIIKKYRKYFHKNINSDTVSQGIFRLISLKGNLKPRDFDDILQLNLVLGKLNIINDLDFNKYLAGVVESESGTMAMIEFYKAQAIICRTYTYKNLKKHDADGYHLCDGVHCQAFKGRSAGNVNIPAAVNQTNKLVILVDDTAFIDALFSANCGGAGMSSEALWGTPKSYLQKNIDKYCVKERQAFWEKRISVSDWISYLKRNKFDISNLSNASDFEFVQENRLTYYTLGQRKIPLSKIRTDWGLRSTFFSIVADDNYLIFKGRGYGHGIGMCQEGAMRMAQLGYTYSEIINNYYKNVKIVKKNF